MEALGVVGSVVGIVSLGIQISQILQTQIDTVAHADDTISKFAVELHATASALNQLVEVLTEDEKFPKDRIFSLDGRRAVGVSVRQCNGIFREAAVLLAKSGESVLASVDEFQRRVEKNHEQNQTKPKEEPILLTIELSKTEHLLWIFKVHKIEQCIADLERQKSTLSLFVGIANLGRSRKSITEAARMEDDEDSDTKTLGSSTETLVDKVYYLNRSKIEAEDKLEDIKDAQLDAIEIAGLGPVSSLPTGKELIQNWPYISESKTVATMREVLSLGIILSAWTYGPQYADGFSEGSWTRVPISERELFDISSAFSLSMKKGDSVTKQIKRLPVAYQRCVSELLALELEGYSHEEGEEFDLCHPRLLYLDYRKTLWKRILQKSKTLLPLYTAGLKSHELLIIIAHVQVAKTERGAPEPPIRTPYDWPPVPPRGSRGSQYLSPYYPEDEPFTGPRPHSSYYPPSYNYNERTSPHHWPVHTNHGPTSPIPYRPDPAPTYPPQYPARPHVARQERARPPHFWEDEDEIVIHHRLPNDPRTHLDNGERPPPRARPSTGPRYPPSHYDVNPYTPVPEPERSPPPIQRRDTENRGTTFDDGYDTFNQPVSLNTARRQDSYGRENSFGHGYNVGRIQPRRTSSRMDSFPLPNRTSVASGPLVIRRPHAYDRGRDLSRSPERPGSYEIPRERERSWERRGPSRYDSHYTPQPLVIRQRLPHRDYSYYPSREHGTGYPGLSRTRSHARSTYPSVVYNDDSGLYRSRGRSSSRLYVDPVRSYMDTSSPPSQEEKKSVAEDLLRRWTTTYDGPDRTRSKSRSKSVRTSARHRRRPNRKNTRDRSRGSRSPPSGRYYSDPYDSYYDDSDGDSDLPSRAPGRGRGGVLGRLQSFTQGKGSAHKRSEVHPSAGPRRTHPRPSTRYGASRTEVLHSDLAGPANTRRPTWMTGGPLPPPFNPRPGELPRLSELHRPSELSRPTDPMPASPRSNNAEGDQQYDYSSDDTRYDREVRLFYDISNQVQAKVKDVSKLLKSEEQKLKLRELEFREQSLKTEYEYNMLLSSGNADPRELEKKEHEILELKDRSISELKECADKSRAERKQQDRELRELEGRREQQWKKIKTTSKGKNLKHADYERMIKKANGERKSTTSSSSGKELEKLRLELEKVKAEKLRVEEKGERARREAETLELQKEKERQAMRNEDEKRLAKPRKEVVQSGPHEPGTSQAPVTYVEYAVPVEQSLVPFGQRQDTADSIGRTDTGMTNGGEAGDDRRRERSERKSTENGNEWEITEIDGGDRGSLRGTLQEPTRRGREEENEPVSDESESSDDGVVRRREPRR